jgi:hypothetical protein
MQQTKAEKKEKKKKVEGKTKTQGLTAETPLNHKKS